MLHCSVAFFIAQRRKLNNESSARVEQEPLSLLCDMAELRIGALNRSFSSGVWS
jgi:hypothetical protein